METFYLDSFGDTTSQTSISVSWKKNSFIFFFASNFHQHINCNLENKHVQYFTLKVLNIFNKLCKYFASFARITDITPNIEAGPIDNWVCQKNTILKVLELFKNMIGYKRNFTLNHWLLMSWQKFSRWMQSYW